MGALGNLKLDRHAETGPATPKGSQPLAIVPPRGFDPEGIAGIRCGIRKFMIVAMIVRLCKLHISRKGQQRKARSCLGEDFIKWPHGIFNLRNA